jgi:hypothetical protein
MSLAGDRQGAAKSTKRRASRLASDAQCTVRKRKGGAGRKAVRRKASSTEESSDEAEVDDSGDDEGLQIGRGKPTPRRRLEPMLLE